MLASVESWALFFHLLGAFFFFGGVIVAGVAFEAARRRSEPRDVALLLGLTRVGVLLVAVGAVLVLPFGLWLVHLGDWGYGAGWVDAALALFVVIALLGGIGGQPPRRARKLAARLAQDGQPETPELRGLLDDRTALVLNYLSGLLVLVIVVLMVFKPGAPSTAGASVRAAVAGSVEQLRRPCTSPRATWSPTRKSVAQPLPLRLPLRTTRCGSRRLSASATIGAGSTKGGWMYRQRIRQQILYGQFREYMQIAEEVVALRQKLGLAVPTLWVPAFGTANEVVWEIDYSDLATFQRENEAFYSDAEVMKHWRQLWQLAAQGSIQDELLQEAPRIA